MKVHIHPKGSLVCVLVMITLFIVPKCTTNSATHPAIYIVTWEKDTSQIWQFTEDKLSPSTLYEIAQSSGRTVDTIFPPEELDRLRLYLGVPSVPALLPDSLSIDKSLRLSSQGTLAWKEGDTYCVNGAAGCFGVARIMTLDINAQNAETALKIPLNADGEHALFSSQVSWSPNGHYLATMTWIRSPVPAIVNLVQADTGEITEITGTIDSGPPLTWSPDSKSVAWELSGRFGRSTTGGGIRIYTLSTATHKDIQLDGLWVQGWSMDWSPDGNYIVFSGANKDDQSSNEKEIKLYLLNPKTEQTQLIPVAADGVLENPRWSPDGKFLAADFRPTNTDLYSSLLIIDPNTGEIVVQLTQKRSERIWHWDRESKEILILLGIGSYNDKREVGIFNIEDGTLRTLILPEELATKQIADLIW